MQNAAEFRSALGRFLENVGRMGLRAEQRGEILSQFKAALNTAEDAALRMSRAAKPPVRHRGGDMERLEAALGHVLQEAGDNHSLFLHFDIRGRNTLEPWELQQGMESLGVALSMDDCSALVAKYGSRGELSYTEFANMHEDLTTRRVSEYNVAYAGDVVRAATPRQAATFDWHESKEEKLLHLKELITDKIYQAFGSTTQAFLDIDTSDNSRLSVKEFMVAMREFGINMSRQQAITLFAPFAKERRNHLNLSEFTRFCESRTKVVPTPVKDKKRAMTDTIGLHSPAKRAPARRGAAPPPMSAPAPTYGAPSAGQGWQRTPQSRGAPRGRFVATHGATGRDLFRAAHAHPGPRGSNRGAAAAVTPPPVPAAAAAVNTTATVQKINDAIYRSGSVRSFFHRLHVPKAGVSAPELKAGLHRIGCNLPLADITAVVRKFGQRGTISLHSFMTMLSNAK